MYEVRNNVVGTFLEHVFFSTNSLSESPLVGTFLEPSQSTSWDLFWANVGTFLENKLGLIM